jgi:transcriptional regulator with XRE-family HTH domain
MRRGCKSLKTRQIPFLTNIAYCNIHISICNMKLGEKIRYLREVEGSLRGLDRPMTQQEMVKAVRQELRKSISQSYLSQIESGARPHMTQSSRALLAKFFKVHPGFLVDDPEGYHTELTSDLRTTEGQLDVWLLQGSEKFVGDPEVSEVLIKAARERDTRRSLLLLGAILDTPGLAERLLEALRPELVASGNRERGNRGHDKHHRDQHSRASNLAPRSEGRGIR